MKKERIIKGLRTQITEMQGDLEALKIKMTDAQRDFQAKNNRIEALKTKINLLSVDKTPRVSEHAMLRYFERVLEIDLKTIEELILNEEVLSMVDVMGGNGGFPNTNFKVLMKNYTVTTIIKNDDKEDQ